MMYYSQINNIILNKMIVCARARTRACMCNLYFKI